MIQAKLTDEMINSLRKLIGDTFVGYSGAMNNNVAYGNVRINGLNSAIEIQNEVRPLPLFSETEDISMFSCIPRDVHSKFTPFCDEPWQTTDINEPIVDIKIINDIVAIDGTYSITFDMAIVIETPQHSYVFSRDWYYSETIAVNIDRAMEDIYPINHVVDDWNPDDDRLVSVTRTTISLKERNPNHIK